MLTKTIGQLSAAASITTADKIEIEQSGASKYGTVAMIVSAAATVASFRVPRGYISGLLMTNDADTDHDISFGVGECSDSTGAYILQNTSVFIKQIDATWSAGTNAGGLFTGSVATALTYHCFVIRKDSDGSLDFGFDTSLTAANIPSGYTYYRRVGSVKTNASANIINFISKETHSGVNIIYKDNIEDSDAALSSTSVFIQLSIPSGVSFLSNVGLNQNGADAGVIVLTSPDVNDFSISATYNANYSNTLGSNCSRSTLSIWTDTGAQIRARASGAGQDYAIYTLGYFDPRTI